MAEDIERVTPAQIESLRGNFQEKILATNADFCPEDLERVKTDNLWMRRFIAAQENDITKATEMLYETCQWRKEFGTNDLDHTKLNQGMLEKGVLFIRNKDNWGKHLLVFKAKLHNKGVDDMEDVKKFIVYYFERIERTSQSDQISVIFDMKDTGWSNMDMDFIRYLITLLKQYYPYFVNYLMIFEMPWLLKSAWNIIKGWLPPKFVDRVKFVDKKTIHEFINEKNQLTAWGGQDNYTYSFEPEVRKKLSSKGRKSEATNKSQAPMPDAPRLRKISNKVKFTDRDGSIDTTDIHIDERAQSPTQRSSPASQPSLRSAPSSDGPRLADIDETINFVQEGNELVGRFLITNVAPNGEPIIFKLKTTSPDKFRCRPTIGMMDGGMSSKVTVTPYDYVVRSRIPHERFQIQVTMLPRSLLIEGSGTDSDSPSNSSRGVDFERLNVLWKQVSSVPGKPVESHRLNCTLDSSALASQNSEVVSIGGGGGPSVRMSEEDMRKGLADLEKKMSDSTGRIVKARLAPFYTLAYITLGILGFMLLMVIWTWWSMPSSAAIAKSFPPQQPCICPILGPVGGTGGAVIDPGSGVEIPPVYAVPPPVPPARAGNLPEDDDTKRYSCVES